MNRGPAILSIVIVVAVYASLHVYMWARLIRKPELPPPWRRRATAALTLIAVYGPAVFLLARLADVQTPAALVWPGLLWMGLALYLVLALVATDLLRWLAELWLWWRRRESFRQGATQRRLYRVFAASAFAAALATTAVGAITAACGPTVRRVDVVLPKLRPALDGLKLVQLSDLHIGRTIARSYVEDVVSQVNELSPDLVVITGDLVDGNVDQLREAVAPLFRLEAPRGIYFVTGNHDLYSGAAPWRAHLAAGGIRVLVNESVRIGDERGSFDLAGVEDRRGNANLWAALARCSPETPTLLLAHRPSTVFEQGPTPVDLQLSGHTHGGQLWPFTFFVGLAAPYPTGLHRHGETQLYVSQGTGYVGPPLRLGTRAEITLLTLRASPAS